MKKAALIVAVALALAGCATWTQSTVEGGSEVAAAHKTPIDKIAVIEGSFKDRKYQTLGEIQVTVNKTTIFNADPTPAAVNQALREKASEMGADAVVHVRYGTVGMSLFSWGSLRGEGEAIKFAP